MEFKIGDVVKLKSGGPDMTVEKLGKGMTGEMFVTCVWFKDGTPVKFDFSPPALCAV